MTIVLQTLSLVDGFAQWSLRSPITAIEAIQLLLGVANQSISNDIMEIRITITTKEPAIQASVRIVEDTKENTSPDLRPWAGSGSPGETSIDWIDDARMPWVSEL